MKWLSNIVMRITSRWITPPEPVDPESLSSMELYDYILNQGHGCVTCDKNPKFKVINGPSGGMSQNVWCPECGTRYNITLFGRSQGLIDILTKHERDFGIEADVERGRQAHNKRKS